ncbi:DNA-binding response OmpR family regulator [Variovorax sp. 54]|uniref:winged helix-turn-helix transcriptional regulator n=1 Tax=Variovorax sp. 54 TaxID=2035212 RepID=UPI000C1A591D|nr:response regulator transcription factor [Variovorax sp. 54]PIF74809.1 DNA-binding response OmpR family regulator [Variovorax sp. 54]
MRAVTPLGHAVFSLALRGAWKREDDADAMASARKPRAEAPPGRGPASPAAAGPAPAPSTGSLEVAAHGGRGPGVAVRRIAVLEHSDPDRHFVASAVREAGHEVIEFSLLRKFAQVLSAGEQFDLLLLALDGSPDVVWSAAKFLRRLAGESTPLLLLMRPEQLLGNKVVTSELADDFVLMPCEDCELVVRVFRVLASRAEAAKEVFCFGRFEFDPVGCTVSIDGHGTRLQPRQFELALFLFRHANRAYSREEIFRAVWGDAGPLGQTRTVDVHMTRLRKLLKMTGTKDVSLVSIRGFGYRLFMNTYPSA